MSSDLNFNLENNWKPSRVDLDLSSSYKRKKLNDDTSILKESLLDRSKPSNKEMIKAIDSDDAHDYLRVRKQKGETKLNIKQAKIFDKVLDLGLDVS